MRADDDVYVRTDRLGRFLRGINSSQPMFIGQAGLGAKSELGRLSLASHVSRAALSRGLGPRGWRRPAGGATCYLSVCMRTCGVLDRVGLDARSLLVQTGDTDMIYTIVLTYGLRDISL